MPRNIHALRMFIWIAPKESQAGEFYEKVIGLPLVRRVGDHAADIYWGGEAVALETIYASGKQLELMAEPAATASAPIFRVHDLDSLVGRLKSAGARVSAVERRGAGREAWVQDRDGYWSGLRERSREAALPQDLVARRRAARGEAFNPGCKSMPPGIQELGWVVRYVHDLPRMTEFYMHALGMERIGEESGHILLDIGDGAILELAPGGRARPVPADRHDAGSIILFRAADLAALHAQMGPAGGHVVNERIPIHWAHLAYYADPEGGLFGLEQDLHPGSYAPERFVLPEVLEAERRWRESEGSERSR